MSYQSSSVLPVPYHTFSELVDCLSFYLCLTRLLVECASSYFLQITK
jgi:hypothetical protein